MSKKTEKAQPKRTPADKILLDFIQDNKIVLVVDEISILNTDIKDAIYVSIKRPRVRAFYLDEIGKTKTNGEDKPKIDIIS